MLVELCGFQMPSLVRLQSLCGWRSNSKCWVGHQSRYFFECVVFYAAASPSVEDGGVLAGLELLQLQNANKSGAKGAGKCNQNLTVQKKK